MYICQGHQGNSLAHQGKNIDNMTDKLTLPCEVCHVERFMIWLQSEMKSRGVKQADIMRTGIVTDGTVSQLFTGKIRSLTFNMCKAISQATNIPLVTIYRKAGLLPSLPDPDLWIEQITPKLLEVPAYMRSTVESFIDTVNKAHR